MVLTLPDARKEGESEEDFATRLQEFDPAEKFLNEYTQQSTDPRETDFSVDAYAGDTGRGGFFSPDGQGRPSDSQSVHWTNQGWTESDQVAAEYGGAKGKLKREVEAFGKQFPIRTTDTPVDRPQGRGMGDRWEGPLSSGWRPRTVEVGRIASRDGRNILARDRPAVRPTGQSDVGSSREDFTPRGRSFIGGYSRGQRTGSGAASAASPFASSGSANPNTVSVFLQKQLTNLQGSPSDAGQRNPNWWGQGRSPGENTRPWGNVRQSFGINVDESTLLGEDYRKQQVSDTQFAKGKTPSGPLKGYRATPGFGTVKTAAANVKDVLTGNRTVADVYKNPKTLEQVNPGGFQSGPTPAVRQFVERGAAFVPKLNAYANTAALLYKGMDSVTRARTGQSLAERISNPVATLERNAEQFKQQADVNRAKRDELVGGVRDWFVDKMGNVKKDVQTRNLRQAGLGTDIQGNIVTESQRTKAADEFIAGIENWEPLTDQRTFEKIPEVRGGIVDGQRDEDYLVAPEAVTETTTPAGSAFNKENLPGWFQHSYTDDDGTFMGYNYSGGFGALTPGPGSGEDGTPESGYGTPGYNWDTKSGGTSWTFTDYDTYSSANKSPVVSDVGTVNELGEVVPNLGVKDGDDVSFIGMFGLQEKEQEGPHKFRTNQGTKDAQMIQMGYGSETPEEFKQRTGHSIYEYLNLPTESQYESQGDQSSTVSGQEIAQVASADDLSGVLGATNQPATVDLNKSTELPPPPTPDDFLEEYIPPSQPYDQQEPVGDYIKNEETGEVTQLYDAPTPETLPSDVVDFSYNPDRLSQVEQQETAFKLGTAAPSGPSSDPAVIASDRAVSAAYAAWKAASNAQQNYLGGRTAGTEEEYNQYMKLAAAESAASKRLDAAYNQQARAMAAYTARNTAYAST